MLFLANQFVQVPLKAVYEIFSISFLSFIFKTFTGKKKSMQITIKSTQSTNYIKKSLYKKDKKMLDVYYKS